MKKIITPGMRFGYLVVMSEVPAHVHPNGKTHRRFLCRCDCGIEKEFLLYSMVSGNTTSCGCSRISKKAQTLKRPYIKHGYHGTRIYHAWHNMWRRCTESTNDRFANYGGRGITVCDRWQKFENFLADMGEPPPGKTLDRRDNDGNYEPSNCQWATADEQRNNKQGSHHIEIDGITKSITKWIDVLGLGKTTIYRRIKQGADPKTAIVEDRRLKEARAARAARSDS